jgi:isoquinoline 1-oxidoreductase subunit beta
MGVKRRAFLIGATAIAGGGIFTLNWSESSSVTQAKNLTRKKNESSFDGWLKIAEDDTITIYSPHVDFGQGSHTALAQMLADELDADWSNVRVEQAPADLAFANSSLVRATLNNSVSLPSALSWLTNPLTSQVARTMGLQITGGSTAIRMTGQYGMRVLGAAARIALLETAALQMNVPLSELLASESKITHKGTGKFRSYGELAADAANRSLQSAPTLKNIGAFKIIGTSTQRLDIPKKVTGEAIYGIDFTLPDIRIATIMAAPVCGGKLLSVDQAPALSVTGVEHVIKLENAVAVVANGYWPAIQGLRALLPKFSDGGFGSVSSASIFEAQAKLIANENPHKRDQTNISAFYQVPFLHQATMEPPSLIAHFKDGTLKVWGGLQDPLEARAIIAEVSGLSSENVSFNPMIMGGGFGRRFPQSCQFIAQVVQIAMQLPYPIKLIWSREEDFAQGAYRPQMSANLSATLTADKRIATWTNNYAQNADASEAAQIPYVVATQNIKYQTYISHLPDSFWRSVDPSQHGFYTESFMDELAHLADADPYQFRRTHLAEGSRHQRVLDEVAKRSGWESSATDAGIGHGIALVESTGSIVAQVVKVSMVDRTTLKVESVFAVVDCGIVINPQNAEAQVAGGIIMGLSAALGEQITMENGAVMQTSFPDYPIMQMADVPLIDVYFMPSEELPGGVGEPGLPPVAPALANAIFALNGKRIRQLPISQQT